MGTWFEFIQSPREPDGVTPVHFTPDTGVLLKHLERTWEQNLSFQFGHVTILNLFLFFVFQGASCVLFSLGKSV